MQIFSDEFVTQMKMGLPAETRYGQLLIDYIRKQDFSPSDIPLTLMEELLTLDANLEMFFIVPILLFIIKDTIAHALYREKDTSSVEI